MPTRDDMARFTRPASLRLHAPRIAGVVALAVYARAPWNGWAVDDTVLASHPLLQAAGTLPQALTSPWWYPTQHLYRPLATGIIGLGLLAGHGAPWLPHVINVVLHAVVAMLVTRLCLRWLPPAASLSAGLFFALLPAHAEAVATLVGAAELLAAAALVGLLLVVTGEGGLTRRRWWTVALLSAAALASKEGGVAAPVLALATAWACPPARRDAWRWTAAAATGTLLMLGIRVAALGSLGGDVPHALFRTMSTTTRITTALALLPRTAAMLVLPVRPAINYSTPWRAVQSPSALAVSAGMLLLAMGLGALVIHVRRPSAASLGLCIAAATLGPTTNLLFGSGVVLSGRSVYAPSVGAALVFGALLAWLGAGAWRRATPVLAALFLAWSAALTWREVRVWRSSATAVDAAAARDPDSYWVPRGRAYLARDAGQSGEAIGHFRKAAELFPLDYEMLTDGATVALAEGDTVEAVQWLRAAITAHPRAARARVRLVSIVRARGDSLEATRLLRDGLRAEPDARTLAGLLAR